MCIAISKPAGKVLTKKTMLRCWINNPDGAGFMYADRGVLHVEKGFFKFTKFWKAVRQQMLVKDRHLVLHFRIATSGKVDYDNCHPHMIHDGLAYVHNGIIRELNDDKVECDTIRMARIMASLPEGFIHDDSISKLIEMAIGSGNKFVFMDAGGFVRIINESAGLEVDGVWYSNSSFRTVRYYASTTPTAEDWEWSRPVSCYGTYGSYGAKTYEPLIKTLPVFKGEVINSAADSAKVFSDANEDAPADATSVMLKSGQRYDEAMPEGVADDYGMTAADYEKQAEAEMQYWLARPHEIGYDAFKDLQTIAALHKKGETVREAIQEWLDIYTPLYYPITRKG